MKKGKRSRFGPLASSSAPIDTTARNVIRPAKTYYATEPATGRFLCVICGREFQSKMLFEQHQKEAHKAIERIMNRQQSADSAKGLKCRSCGNAVLALPKALRRHLVRKHGFSQERAEQWQTCFAAGG